jgi:hypothetical protein
MKTLLAGPARSLKEVCQAVLQEVMEAGKLEDHRREETQYNGNHEGPAGAQPLIP